MSLKSSLLRNFGAGAWGNVSLVLVRLMQVPLLLLYLGVEDYGRWLVLSSLPSWLALANMGFGSVASNEMTMAVAAGNMKKARSLFSTTYALIAAIGAAGMSVFIMVAPFLPWETFLKVSQARHQELVYAAIWMVLSVFVSFTGELYNGRFKAAKKAHQAILISSFRPWISIVCLFVALNLSSRFDYIAFASLCSTLGYLLVLKWLSWRALPGLSFAWSEIEMKWFNDLFRKGVAFQAFPLGNALLFQGNILIVQAMLGPAAVALFGTARTLVRSVSQVLGLINHAVWPELTYLFGSRDLVRIARLHRVAVAMAIVVACAGVVVLSFMGPLLYELWVGKTIELPRSLLFFFLLPIPFNALWSTSSVVHAACNKHEGLAKRYLFASALSLLFCFVLSYYQDIEGAALSTLVAEIVLIPYVFNQSLKLTGDNWKAFLPGLLQEATTQIAAARKLIPIRSSEKKIKQKA